MMGAVAKSFWGTRAARFATLGVVAAAVVAVSVHAQEGLGPRFVAEQEAMLYAASVVQPTLAAAAKNPAEIPAVRDRLQRLVDPAHAEPLGITALPFPLPNGRIAQLDVTGMPRRPALAIAIPTLMTLQENKPKTFFEDLLLLNVVVEVIRYELAQKDKLPLPAPAGRGPRADLRADAAVWGRAILEIVRPWSKLGRVPDQRLMALSFKLQELRDNLESPNWIAAYAQLR
jgi:hypothetical protein